MEGSRFLRGGWGQGTEAGVKSSPGANSSSLYAMLGTTPWVPVGNQEPPKNSFPNGQGQVFQPLWRREEDEAITTDLEDLFKIVSSLDNSFRVSELIAEWGAGQGGFLKKHLHDSGS